MVSSPGRKTEALTDLVQRAVRRAPETNQAVGLNGHTITCPYTDIEAGPECETCEYQGEGWEREPCKLGIPQNADYTFSKRFDESDRYCESYKQRGDITCDCGMLDS